MTADQKINAPAVWTLDAIQKVCILLESFAPEYGAHVALTGGCLYKECPRKDADILIYRIRQVPEIDMENLFYDMVENGFTWPEGRGWCYKTEFEGKPIDLFFPEEQESADPASEY